MPPNGITTSASASLHTTHVYVCAHRCLYLHRTTNKCQQCKFRESILECCLLPLLFYACSLICFRNCFQSDIWCMYVWRHKRFGGAPLAHATQRLLQHLRHLLTGPAAIASVCLLKNVSAAHLWHHWKFFIFFHIFLLLHTDIHRYIIVYVYFHWSDH